MITKILRRPSTSPRVVLAALAFLCCGLPATAQSTGAAEDRAPARLRRGDRVAWVGSSSTRIGVWPDTVQFLLRTRHPGLDLEFGRFTTGGGTFATGLEHLDEWLGDFHPTVVVFNYGANDAGAGREGLERYKDEMARCVARAEGLGARVLLVTPQAADARRAGAEAAARRTLYAETMLGFGREQGWTVLDIHHPLAALQQIGERDDPDFSILKDTIHLTHPAYIAWGVVAYDRLELPWVRSEAVLDADGDVVATERCAVRDVEAGDDGLAFTRLDEVLPILPPGPLPPRGSVPLEAHSRYLLTVQGLAPGRFEILCEGRPLGVVDAEALAAGVNLNILLRDGDREAPWSALAEAIVKGERLDEIGRTRWRFEVRPL